MSWSKDATVRARSSDRDGATLIPVVRILETPEWLPGEPVLAALVPGRKVVVGRGDDADLRLKDGMTSRAHASLTNVAGDVQLLDESANGTFVDGRPMARGSLEDGAVIRMGDSFLVLRWTTPQQADAFIRTILGESPAVQELRRSIDLMAPNDASVLVLGESGTGKELVARALHDGSKRTGDFVAVNCAAVPGALAESQLFGHVAGAFTGAKNPHEGYFRAADGGTLFLDEVGDLPMDIQPKLLRVLEERTVVPVGSTKPIPVDLRLVAATHRDLEKGIDEGWFRGDLFSRINDLVLRTPPLRERREDVLPLLRHSISDERPFDAELVDALLNAPWRFNVRELFKVGRELMVRAEGAERFELKMVEARLSRPTLQSAPAKEAAATEAAAPSTETPAPTREALIELLERHGGNVSHVAKAADRSRKQIYRYLEEHDIDPASFRPTKL